MNRTGFQYNVNQIVFGITTNADRVFFIVHYLKFWATLPDINCRIFFHKRAFRSLAGIKQFLKSYNISCSIDITMVQRYQDRGFDIIKKMWDSTYNSTSKYTNSEWFVINDDDTMWFIDNLLDILKLHNSSEEIYLGGHSDSIGHLQEYGSYFAYGGGGIILSKRLVGRIVQDIIATEKYKGAVAGDKMMGNYIVKHLKVALTNDMRFQQMDFRDDGSGFLEGGIDGLANFHHMFSWWKPFPARHISDLDQICEILKSSYRNLGELYLKRYVWIDRFNHQTIVLTMGYSIAVFNRTLTEDDLNKVEHTHASADLYKKTRPKETKKRSWFIKRVSSKRTKNQNITTFTYENASENRSVMEVILIS